SKTRGFGQIEFEIKKLVFEEYAEKTEFLKEIKEFFEIDEDNSIKLGNNYIRENLFLKDEYKEINIESPNKFIETLFNEVK
ncbi:MAG: hypothetical protein HXM47_06265, partial [Pseudoleptotrichia goodfellowii]|nr:hypothetical protein [Pseudoleptotrichia goodfellowii]